MCDLYFQIGLFTERNSNGTLADFRALAPQSVLLKNDMADYSSSSGGDIINLTSNTVFSAMLGFQFGDKQKTIYKTNPLLKLGISYFSGTTLTGSAYKEDRKTFDTLISTQTGQTYYLDSVTTKNYSMDYSSEQLRLDASLIFRTTPENRWSLFTGIGITAGLSLNANTNTYYYEYSGVETRDANGNTINSPLYNNTTFFPPDKEKISNKNNLAFSAYIPIGIDVRFGKTKQFWKRAHVFYELKPGINITSIPELRTITNASLQHGFGFRYSWE